MTSTATSGTTHAPVDLHRGEFRNEPFIDFSQPDNRKAMEEALAQVKSMFGREYPLTIGGQRITTTEKIQSHNPSHPDQVIGIFQKASVEMANEAVEKAHAAFDALETGTGRRARCLHLSRRRHSAEAPLRIERLAVL